MKTLRMNLRTFSFVIFAVALLFAGCEKDNDVMPDARLVYEENFDGNSGWRTANEENYKAYEADGKYVQVKLYSDGFYNYGFYKPVFSGAEKKQIVEYTVRIKEGTGGVNFILNADQHKETVISLSANQYFKIFQYSYQENRTVEIVDWTENKLINVTQQSAVKMELENETLNIYVNGKKLYQWNSSGMPTLDYFGLGISVWDGSTSTIVELDKIRAYAVD